jgi:hypothetical protein
MSESDWNSTTGAILSGYAGQVIAFCLAVTLLAALPVLALLEEWLRFRRGESFAPPGSEFMGYGRPLQPPRRRSAKSSLKQFTASRALGLASRSPE